MRYENVKSLVLLLLVVASVVLTGSLWTYQPQLEPSDKKNVHEVSISDQEESGDLIKPSRVLFHLDNIHYGTVKDDDINPLIDEVSLWSFYDLSQAKIVSDARLYDISHTNNNVEITFPDLVPFELYKGVLHVETNNVPNAAFNRIVINLDSNSRDGSTIYFIDSKENRVYESHVNPDRISELITKISIDKKMYERYGEHKLPNGQTIFLPESKTKMDVYKYFPDYIDPEKFKNALFKDPKVVRRDIMANGEKFTDVLSMMNVDYITNTISYINPAQDQGMLNSQEMDQHVLSRSIDFVNEHSGWTDSYRYFSLGEYQQTTIFQLYLDGRPVFNENGMTEIRQVWGKEEIYKYRRPYFSLDIPIPLPDKKPVELPSGEEVLNYLQDSSEIEDVELLEDMMIGYKLSIDPENPKVFVLEPSWYYLYGGSWLRLALENKGGDSIGLE